MSVKDTIHGAGILATDPDLRASFWLMVGGFTLVAASAIAGMI